MHQVLEEPLQSEVELEKIIKGVKSGLGHVTWRTSTLMRLKTLDFRLQTHAQSQAN